MSAAATIKKPRIAREEIFGPIVSILRWSDEGEVLALANALEYGPDCLDLDPRSRLRSLAGIVPGSGLCLDQRREHASRRRALWRLQVIGQRARGVDRRARQMHAAQERGGGAAPAILMHPKHSPAHPRVLKMVSGPDG
jgi:hypothetical protein